LPFHAESLRRRFGKNFGLSGRAIQLTRSHARSKHGGTLYQSQLVKKRFASPFLASDILERLEPLEHLEPMKSFLLLLTPLAYSF
jgi:hypothetical protein